MDEEDEIGREIDSNLEHTTKPEELQGLLWELNESQDEDKMGKIAENILQITKSFVSFTGTSLINQQLHGSAVTLWNKAVLMKSSSSISLSLNAQLRQVALTLVFLCTTEDNSEQLLKKQITMAIKTGKAWLECDNPVMAETSLELAYQFWDRLRKNTPVQTRECLVLQFKIFCSQAEASLGCGNNEKALELVHRAREIFTSNDKEISYLAMLCYNCGLQQFQYGKYSNAVLWLKESYDTGRGCLDVGSIKQARTLRLLANSYLEWDGQTHWQKALNAVGLANSEHSHLAGLLLKLSILLQFVGKTDRIAITFKDILSHSDINLNIGTSAIKLAIQYNQPELALSSLQSLQQILKSPSDQQALKQLHLELLFEKGMIEGAKQMIEECIENHVGSEPLDTRTVQQFHIILWDQASKSFKREDYQSALDWYRYSMALFPVDNTQNLNIAKLQRNIASCYIALHELSKAKEAIDLVIFHDKTSAHSYYLSFKIAVLLKQKEQALQSLQTMMECVQDADLSGLLAMAAQLAFENNSRELAIQALENVVETSTNIQQILTSLRCLIRLKLTFMKSEDTPKNKNTHLISLLQYTELARGHLTNSNNDQQLKEEHNSEVLWFAKISWNIAIESGDSFKEMKQAFDTCQKLFSLLPSESSTINRRKTCHLMAAAAGIQAGKRASKEVDTVSHLKDVLSHVQQCRDCCSLATEIHSTDPTLSLLILYEFEAQLLLKSPDALKVLDAVKMCPNAEPKIYENLAALAIQMPPKEGGPNLVKRALRIAIDLYKKSTPPLNIERISRCTHSLVEILIGSTDYEFSTNSSGKEETKTVLLECLQLMESIGKYPEMEIVWHMAKTWNTGIHLYSVLRYKEAEEWCSLGMKFVTFLPQSLSDTYRQQMTSVYTEILDKLAANSLPIQLH